ncbi:hypothetical protein F5H01DRAFT_331578 [Linnemannia elongata]|nr:hypothetical protein F5H01DRAFT_331578 [Linnemannia elongata]
MRISIFLSVVLSLVLGLAFTSYSTAAPVQVLDLEQLQQRHDNDNTADVDDNVGVAETTAATTQDDVAPTRTAILIPCPTNWNPHFGHGPVCNKTVGAAQEVEKEKKPQPLDFGLGP